MGSIIGFKVPPDPVILTQQMNFKHPQKEGSGDPAAAPRLGLLSH